ncbi:hypothetical protein WJX79_003761 [Trebouxia sp. C0005]
MAAPSGRFTYMLAECFPDTDIQMAPAENLVNFKLQGLLNRCKIPQLYIGVLGDTGAGKSSTINCLLGEENVLPVNGMRVTASCII